MIALLHGDTPFPPVEQALTDPNGLLALGGDLSPQRLLEAYRRGIFPWFNPDDPPLWWSPDPRMVLPPEDFKISRSLRKTLRNKLYRVTFDCAFENAMRACAAPRDAHGGTWIVEEMVQAYCALHRLGYAHSVEVWIDGELAGGLYGVALGRMFYGESMFSRRTDTSKIALAWLSAQLKRWQFGLIDCQMHTPHLATLGARTMPRSEFVRRVAELVEYPPVASPWTFDEDLPHELAE
jgi:leucyl/phenylalanyl-tRNA--protein transferase